MEKKFFFFKKNGVVRLYLLTPLKKVSLAGKENFSAVWFLGISKFYHLEKKKCQLLSLPQKPLPQIKKKKKKKKN